MPIFPEREPLSKVTEIPDVPEIPPGIEKGTGVKAIPTQPSMPVKPVSGVAPTQIPTAAGVSIQLPQPQQNLAVWSKGNVGSSLTWWSSFWMRMIKKAIHFGWNILTFSKKE